MRHVFHSSEIPHLWAHQTQEDARSSGRGNLYFKGDTIYSYGSHFPIARHVTNAKKQKAILFTTRDYSVTTQGHKSMVRSAIPSGVPVFYVDNPYHDVGISDVQHKEQAAAAMLAKAKHARTRKESYLLQAEKYLQNAQDMVKFFGLKYKVATPKDLAGAAKEIEEARAKERKAQREREAKLYKDQQDCIERWKNGEPISFPYRIPDAYGRIEGNELVTSKGARVPLEHAKRAWRVVKKLLQTGKTYQRNGHTIHLGHYALDAVDTQGNVWAGCHYFKRAEVERIGTLLEKHES